MKTKPAAVKSVILKFRALVLLGLAAFLFIAQLALAEEALSDDWEFSTSFFMWGAEIEGETATGDDFDVKFKDILDNLDFTFMGDFGVNKGKWGVLTDVIYMDIKNDDSQSLTRRLTLKEVQIKAWIVTAVVTYNAIQSDRWRLDLQAGARYLYLKPEMEIEGPLETRKDSDDGDNLDGIVGVSGKVNLKYNFYLPFHFDVGGGDTKGTWQAYGGVGYKFNSFDLIAGYRYLTWKFDNDDSGGKLFNELTVSGPLFGVTFQF